MDNLTVCREALYLGAPSRPLLACFHSAAAAVSHDCVAVICNPIGYEYVHSHRTMRHLADGLARAGVPALRFDYDGTGDSPGTDLDPDRLSRWGEDIDTAIMAARRLSGRTSVCLIGLRLGATLAAMVSARTPVDYLVLWSPCVSGRRYVREMQALAQVAGQNDKPSLGAVEAAGFLLSEETQQQLKNIGVFEQLARVSKRALVLTRDDMHEEQHVGEHLRRLGIETDTLNFSGYADMMAEPQNTVVPRAALDEIVGWLVLHAPASTPVSPLPPSGPSEMQFDFIGIDGQTSSLSEAVCRFGDAGYLFGIHCQALGEQSRRPTVVLFNSGVVHRVGPNRLYVELARNLAACGFATFRCDIEGVGDSVLRGPGRENHPYPTTADRDAGVVLRFLTERFSTQSFVLMGLCSGAYTSFTAGLRDDAMPISELVLLNPLTFHWEEGDSLATQQFGAIAHYKGSMRSRSSWKKLLRGQVNLVNLAGVAWSYLCTQAGSHINTLAERWVPSMGPPLSRQLRQLFGQNRRVSMFIASGDPGWDMLVSKARHAVGKALERDNLSVQFIRDSDHTFSNQDGRLRLVAAVRDHLLKRYPASASDSTQRRG